VGVATLTRVLAAAFLLVGLACSTTSEPSGDTGQSGCVTDYSCPFGEECTGSGCAPIVPSIYPHIQTASSLPRGPLNDAETTWRAQHNDLLIGGIDPDVARAANPNVRLFEYVVARFHRLDRGDMKATAWALAHGYDPEDFYLHYREDVDVPTWESTVIVPGFPPGRVPGWNPGAPNASATSRDQSRVVGYNNAPDGERWYFANVGNAAYRAFFAHAVEGLIDGTWYYNQRFASGAIDGVMMDEAIWYPLFAEGLLDHSDEYYGIPISDDHPYTHALEELYPFLAQSMMNAFASTKDIMPNYGHVMFLNYPNRCAQNIQTTTPWILGEVWLSYTGTASPTSGSTRTITYDNDYLNSVREIVRQTKRGGRRVLGAEERNSGAFGTDRGKLFTLGLYYLVHNKNTYYLYEATDHTYQGDASTWSWNPAVQYDIGQPDVIPSGTVDFEGRTNTKEHYVFATGPDPVNPSLTYRVLARRFTNALVLVKMLPAGSSVDNASITTHALDGNYGVLQADGLIGPIVTQAGIRNNEALILIPLD
jgi:hypothetical protein